MMMVLVSGAQNYAALTADFYNWQGYSPQPPSLILVPHATTEDILAGGIDDKRLAVDDQGEMTYRGVPVKCLCGAVARLPEFDCPAFSLTRESLDATNGETAKDAAVVKDLRMHDLTRKEAPAPIVRKSAKSAKPAKTKKR